MLESVETAAMAEAWASSAVAEWSALDGRPGGLIEELDDLAPIASAMVRWMDGGEPPSAGPDWVTDVGRHELRRVVRLMDAARPAERGWIFEYEAPSGDRHDLSATLVEETLVGLSVGPEGLAAAASEDGKSGFTVAEASRDDAVADLQRSLDAPIDALSESAEATLPLLIRRLGLVASLDLATSSDRVVPERHVEDEQYAAQVITSSLREELQADPPAGVEHARSAFEQLVAADDADARTLFEVAGEQVTPEVSLDLLVRLVGAYLAPNDLSAHTDAQFDALIDLEPADWTGVIIGVTRASAGTEVDGDMLVRSINRTPEVTTTIPKRDAPRISWAFEQMLFSWQITGVLDEQGRATKAAAWLLPRAALSAWAAPGQS